VAGALLYVSTRCLHVVAGADGRMCVKLDERTERIPGEARWRRASRLRSPRAFARVRTSGRRVSGRLLSLGYTPGEAGAPVRIGFSVSKRIGGAVVRNRVKRRLRDAARHKVVSLAAGWDIVITARPAAAQASYAALVDELHELLTRASLWRERGELAERAEQARQDMP
jgi:ribonuclease P protein component